MPTKASKSSNGAAPKSARKRSASPVDRVRSAAETAVELPVGAARQASRRVNDVISPLASRAGVDKQLKSARGQVDRLIGGLPTLRG